MRFNRFCSLSAFRLPVFDRNKQRVLLYLTNGTDNLIKKVSPAGAVEYGECAAIHRFAIAA